MSDLLDRFSDAAVVGLIGYEVLAAVSQRARWLPTLPLLSSVLVDRPRLVRWAFIVVLGAVMAVHLELVT